MAALLGGDNARVDPERLPTAAAAPRTAGSFVRHIDAYREDGVAPRDRVDCEAAACALGGREQVEFLIDGKVRWREGRSPYTYADDGNQLVTSWLTPGTHRFTVNVLAKDGSRGSATTAARVAPAPPPPAALRGTWARTVTAAEAAAWWTIESSGEMADHDGQGGLAIRSSRHARRPHGRRLRLGRRSRGAKRHLHEYVRGDEGNIWCDHLQPVRYRWTVEGDTLMLSLDWT